MGRLYAYLATSMAFLLLLVPQFLPGLFILQVQVITSHET